MAKEDKNKQMHKHLDHAKKEHTKEAHATQHGAEKKLEHKEHKEHKDSSCGTNSYSKN